MGDYDLALFDVVQANEDGDCLMVASSIETLEEALMKAVERIELVRRFHMEVCIYADFDEAHYELVCTMV